MNGFSRHVHMTSPFSLRYIGQIPDTSPPGPGPKKNHRTMRLLSGLWILRQDRGKANHSGKLLLHSPRVPRQLVGFQDVDDGWYPWITLWLCQNSYWTWDFYGIFMGFLWDFYGIYPLVMTNIAMVSMNFPTNTWSIRQVARWLIPPTNRISEELDPGLVNFHV